jgi:hypothetical protein
MFTEKSGTRNSDGSSTSFKYPPGCSGSDCTYTASLKVIGNNEVEVEVTNKVGEESWTAVAFSKDQFMVTY